MVHAQGFEYSGSIEYCWSVVDCQSVVDVQGRSGAISNFLYSTSASCCKSLQCSNTSGTLRTKPVELSCRFIFDNVVLPWNLLRVLYYVCNERWRDRDLQTTCVVCSNQGNNILDGICRHGICLSDIGRIRKTRLGILDTEFPLELESVGGVRIRGAKLRFNVL